MEGLINKMRNILRYPSLSPRGLAPGTARKTSSKRHIPGGLLPGHGRMRSGHQSPAGSLTSLYKHPTPAILVFLAVLTAGLLFLLPGGLLHAQNDGMIEYPENGTAVVATFSATDPDMDDITWSLEPGGDFEHFTIDRESGELEFAASPNYEMPRGLEISDDNTNTNTYAITVTASDGDTDPMTAMKVVMVKVTDVEERATIELSTRQPVVGRTAYGNLGK